MKKEDIKCNHKYAYRPHFNCSYYCDDCKKFLEYQDNGKGEYILKPIL